MRSPGSACEDLQHLRRRGEVAAELGIIINAVERRWTRACRYSITLLTTLGIESGDGRVLLYI
jgi:hypothetical protein